MKKRGFTLAELLIVLGIAGVVAAVILPAINGLMPDKTKINYLKVYDELGKNIKALTSDSSIFPVLLKEGSTDIDVSRYPLVNNSQPLKAPFKDDTKYSGDKKLCNLLAHTFGADSCSTTSYPDKSSFTTSNGMEWWISQTKREINTAENKISYQTDIYVDVDSSKKSSNCMYGEDNCKQPDRFKFLLAADGRLVPADPVGVHYINTRKNLLKKNFNPEGEVLASLDDRLLNKDYHLFEDNEQSSNNGDSSGNSSDSGSDGSETAELKPTDKKCSCLGYCTLEELGQLNMVCLDEPDYDISYIALHYFDRDRGDFSTTYTGSHLQGIFDNGYGVRFDYYQSLGVDVSKTKTEVKVYYDVFYVCAAYWDDDYVYSGTTCYVNDKYKDFFNSKIVTSAYKTTRDSEYKDGHISWAVPESIKVDSIVYVQDWREPIGVFTLKYNTLLMAHPHAERTILYNPLERTNLNVEDPNLKYAYVRLFYSNVEPRYDLKNVYFISPDVPAHGFGLNYDVPWEQVKAWVNKDT